MTTDNSIAQGGPMEVVSTKQPDFKQLWITCEIDSNRQAELQNTINRIHARRVDYILVQASTGVPWQLVAALHYRESCLDFNACLHNGEPWNKVTTLVPKGRGPFHSWSEAAIDALKLDGLDLIKFTDVPTMLVMAEKFNGMGYRRTGELSPYVWAGTNHSDETGKYTSDGHYSPSAQETQLGVAAILMGLVASDLVMAA